MILLPFVSFLSAFSSPSNMRRPAFIPLPLAACVVAVMALAVCAQAEEAGISAAEKIVNEDPFCAAVEGVNQFTDVSSQEEMVKGPNTCNHTRRPNRRHKYATGGRE